MKKLIVKTSQILTGASTAVVLFAGRVMASGMADLKNPAQAGAEMARGNGMPAELIGVNGVFTQIVNTILYAVGIISVIMLIYGGSPENIESGEKPATSALPTPKTPSCTRLSASSSPC